MNLGKIEAFKVVIQRTNVIIIITGLVHFIMVVRNKFLINVVVHDTIIGNCFCDGCRARHLHQVSGCTNNELYALFMRVLPDQEEVRLDKLHQTVLSEIVHGKAYKESSIANTNYIYFKSWAKHAPQFQHLPAKELAKICRRVNEASSVFDNWDTIVNNLTDTRMDQIDARLLTVGLFFEAKSLSWCLRHNENIRRSKRKNQDNEGEPSYPEDKYNAIMQHIYNSGILDDAGNDPKIAAMIGRRIQRDMV